MMELNKEEVDLKEVVMKYKIVVGHKGTIYFDHLRKILDEITHFILN